MMAKCMRDCGWMDGDMDEYVHDSGCVCGYGWLWLWLWLQLRA